MQHLSHTALCACSTDGLGIQVNRNCIPGLRGRKLGCPFNDLVAQPGTSSVIVHVLYKSKTWAMAILGDVPYSTGRLIAWHPQKVRHQSGRRPVSTQWLYAPACARSLWLVRLIAYRPLEPACLYSLVKSFYIILTR